MRFRKVPRSALLRRFVSSIYTIESEEHDATPVEQRFVSSFWVELCYHAGSPLKRADIGKPFKLESARTVAAGPRLRPMLFGSTGPMRMVGVRLHPWAALPFLWTSPKELLSAVHRLEEVISLGGDRLRQIEGDDGLGRALGFVLAHLEQLARRSSPVEPRVRHAVRAIAERSGCVRLCEVAEELNVSGRRFQQLFRDNTGLTPRRFASILRFETAVRLLRAPARPSLAQLGPLAGYFDQSHLAREFEQYAGTTPARFRDEAMALEEYYTAGNMAEDRETVQGDSRRSGGTRWRDE